MASTKRRTIRTRTRATSSTTQEQGKLHEFYKTFLEDKKDWTGATALQAVLGEDLQTFEPKWRKWVLAIPYKR